MNCLDEMAAKEALIFMGVSVLVLFVFEAITRIINIIFKNRGFHVPAFCMAMIFLGACGLFFNLYISGSDFNLNSFQMIVVDLPWIIWFFPLMLYTTSLIITSRYLKTISVFSYFLFFVCLFMLLYHDILFLCGHAF